MKSIKPILLLALLITCSALMAQQLKPGGASNGTMPTPARDALFECLPNSVFSQVGPTYDQAFYGDESSYYTRICDDYTASAPFSTIRFWGSHFYRCPIGSSVDFTIRFYERNPANPVIPGTMVKELTRTVVPFPTGIFSPWGPDEIYRADVFLGENITLLDGWVSISRANATDGCTFGLYCKMDEGNATQYSPSEGWYSAGSKNFFCLGETATTPVSPYAILIGVALIGIFVVLRMRRS